MKILILSSLAYSLTNFRGDLLDQLRQDGHHVIAAAPDLDPKVEQDLVSRGIAFRVTPMQRAGMNPFQDLRLLAAYVSLMREIKPDLVLAYTQKPIIYGGLACRIARVPRFYALMTGLGHAFSPDSQIAGWLRKLISRLYRSGLHRARTIFVFNGNDRQDMIDLGIARAEQHMPQVPGSGINLKRFVARPVPEGPVHFLMISRLMEQKGVYEFLEAAGRLHDEQPGCSFSILGHYELENPTGLDESACRRLAERFPVRFLPGTEDVRPYLERCSVFVLPSYYREGLPRTILEAMATGRAIITTDMPGCRDPILEGKNGLLVPPRDVDALYKAMRYFVERPEQLAIMGQTSRAIAETTYDVEIVNGLLIEGMGLSSGRTLHDGPSSNSSASGLGSKRDPVAGLTLPDKAGEQLP